MEIYHKIFGLDYNAAWISYIYIPQSCRYNRLFKNSNYFYYISLYLKQFANYFMKINKGIDTPIDKKSGKISLSPELSATEKKIKYHKTYFRKAKT